MKKMKPAGVELPAKLVFVESRNRWSKCINSWVVEFRQRQTKSLPPFDGLFKRKLPNAE
jgi:hypothetical protein